MSFRTRTLLILTLALTLIMATFGFIAQLVITQHAAVFEKNAARADLTRVQKALDYEFHQLDTLLHDWSSWTDTFQFAATRNPQYIQDNFTPLTFENLNLQSVLVLDPQGQVIYSAAYDPPGETLASLSAEAVSRILAQTNFLRAAETASLPNYGLLQSGDGVLMLAARPILDNNGQGPSNGTLIFGRRLDGKTTRNLAQITNLSLSMLPWNSARARALLTQYPTLQDTADAQIIEPLDDQQLQALARLNDLSGNPVLLAQIELAREAYRSARATLNWGLLALAWIGFVSIVAVLWLTEKSVLKPLAELTTQIREIGATGDFNQRIHLTAHKELDETAQSINVLLDTITASRRVIAAEQSRYRAIVEDQTDWVIRFLPNGMLTFANKAFCRKFEIRDRKWQGINWFTFLPPEAVVTLGEYCAQLPATPVLRLVLRLHENGDRHERHAWTLRAIFDDTGVYTEIQGVGADISEQYYVEEKLRFLGTHDTLTGLYNRAFFEEQLQEMNDPAQYPISVVVADIDALKWANDQFGHAAGDTLLTLAAGLFLEVFRKQDIVARVGGDEFAILLLRTPSDSVAQIVQRIRARLLAHNSTSVPVLGLSVGWATANAPEELNQTLLTADQEMYKEKFARRPLVQFENAFGVPANSEILSLLAQEGSNALLADRVLNASRAAHFEQALQESEARYRGLLELLPVVTYVAQLDNTATTLFVSQQMESLLGFTAQEWLSQPNLWQQRVHPADRARVLENLQHAHATGESLDAVYRMVARNGQVVWVQDRARVIRLGQTAVLHGLLFDLTVRKETEARLAHQNRELEVLFRLTAVMNQSESLDSIFDAALNSLVEMLDVEHASILLYDAQGVMRFRAWYALSEEYRVRAQGHSPWTRDTLNPVPLLVPDVMLEPSLDGLRDVILKEGIRALGFIPLVQNDELLGKFMLYYDRVHRFSAEEIQLARTIANQTAIAIARTQEQQALQAAKREMEAIFRAVPDIYFRLDDAGTILDYQSGSRSDLFGTPAEFLGRRLQDIAPERIQTQLLEALQQCQTTQTAVTIEYQLPLAQGLQTFEARFLPVNVTQCIIVLRDITARRVSEELNNGLMTLAEQLNSAQTQEQAALIAANVTDRLLGWDAFRFVVYSPAQAQAYETVLAFDIINGVRTRLEASLPPGFTPLIDRTIREDDIIVLRRDPEAESPPQFRFGDVNRPSASLLFVQVRYHDRAIGVLALESYARNAYTEASLKILRTIADQFGMVFARLQVQEDLRAKNLELEAAYDKTIEGWARALELRDTATHGHARRVVDMTIAIARRLGVAEDEVKNIRRGALLHDIGKVGIPDKILFNPKALSEQEWQVMRMHPVYAYEMLKDIAYLDAALDIPYCHHEWWNGAGYPRGLKGEEIPLAARIFAVVDVWDALCSDRSYRSSWTEEQVRHYIQQQAGTQFDPRVVEVFFELLDAEAFV
jgi:diguanylate cyclase (GGDEF)-like protein/PAS domain S-box-containing protein